jgi:hypothetical protein
MLQRTGGGMILPVGPAILARAAGPQRMGRVMSIAPPATASLGRASPASMITVTIGRAGTQK